MISYIFIILIFWNQNYDFRNFHSCQQYLYSNLNGNYDWIFLILNLMKLLCHFFRLFYVVISRIAAVIALICTLIVNFVIISINFVYELLNYHVLYLIASCSVFLYLGFTDGAADFIFTLFCLILVILMLFIYFCFLLLSQHAARFVLFCPLNVKFVNFFDYFLIFTIKVVGEVICFKLLSQKMHLSSFLLELKGQ